MATNSHLIREVAPRTARWTTKVQVVEKASPRTSATSRKFQRLILEDAQHTRVQATIFGSDIEIFQNTLLLNKKYCISNAMVRDILPMHRIVAGPYQWTINSGTLVEDVTEDPNNEESMHHNFIPFSDLHMHSEGSSTIDIIAIAVHISSPQVIKIKSQNRETQIQELLLITEELNPITLTLWDQFIPNECIMISKIIDSWPVVLANRLKVAVYNEELSLSTKSSSFLMLDPKIPEAMSLRSWSTKNKESINNAIQRTPPTKRTKRVSPTKETMINIATAIRTQPTEVFWIKAIVSITDLKQNFWYIGCSNCYKTIYADSGKVYNCLLCNQREVTAEPRCRFEVEIHDSSGSMKATCLGRNAETLFPLTAAQLKDNTNEDGITDEVYLASFSPTQSQTLLLKPYESKGSGSMQQKLTIIAIENQELESKPAESSTGPMT